MNNILRNFLLLLLAFSTLTMITGLFEAVRNEYLFTTMENNFLNNQTDAMGNVMPQTSLDAYTNLKTNFIYTNQPFIMIINFIGELALLYIFIEAYREGFNSKPLTINEIFITYSLMFILLTYFLIILFNYLANVFINQIILLLFNDIYSQLFIFKIFIDYFLGFFLVAVVLSFIGNQIRHFRSIDI